MNPNAIQNVIHFVNILVIKIFVRYKIVQSCV